MPFSHPLLDLEGKVIPGSGLMEYFQDSSSEHPMQPRGFAIARAYNKSKGSFEVFMQESLKALSEAGFDLNYPGFRRGSVEGSHQLMMAHLVADPLPDPK
jgi:hypothetical protein